MAEATITDFTLQRSGGDVNVEVTVRVIRTATEVRLEIPFTVEAWLFERDGNFDRVEVEPHHGEGITLPVDLRLSGNDDFTAASRLPRASVAGDAPGVTSVQISSTIPRGSLPNEVGRDEFYCVAVARPAIFYGMDRSDVRTIQ